jgi:hypothetical protein
MVGKDIYTNCGMVGLTEWHDGEAGWSGPTEKPDGLARRRSLTARRRWPAIPNGRAGQMDTRTGAQRRAHGCPTESGSGPTEGGVLGGGPTAGLRGGPTEDYISVVGPPFWALSSCAQSHLQEMREHRVLMSESGPFWVNSERNVLLIDA